MVNKSFKLDIDGKTYQIDVPGPGMISIDGNVFSVEITGNGVKIDDEGLVASLSEGFAIVGGKLYETEWRTE